MTEFWIRALTVVLGVGYMIAVPWAMFWPQARKPYVVLALIVQEGLVFSIIMGALWAHKHALPLLWFGAPLRLTLLAIGWVYLWRARVDYMSRGQ